MGNNRIVLLQISSLFKSHNILQIKYLIMKTNLVLFIFLFGIGSSFAQRPTPQQGDTNTYLITKTNGTEYIGKILSDDGREILIQTENLGKIYIPKSDVKSIVLISDRKSIIRGEYHSSGPFTTRHAFTTNALPITKGENYTMLNLYGPEVHFAVTNHLNIGIMTTWLASPLVFATKYTIPTKNNKLNFSIGTLFGTSGYFNSFEGYGGLHFANVTYGDRKNNITFSAGYAYLSNINQKTTNRMLVIPGTYTSTDGYSFFYKYKEYSTKILLQGPIVSLAGIARVGTKASFIFDSMFGVFYDSDRYNIFGEITTIKEPTPPNFNDGNYQQKVKLNQEVFAVFLMPGMRFQTKENKAFQVSLAGVALFDQGKNNSLPIPMCTWFYKF